MNPGRVDACCSLVTTTWTLPVMLRAPSDDTPIRFSFQRGNPQQLGKQVELGQARMRANHGQSSDVVVSHSTLPHEADADVDA